MWMPARGIRSRRSCRSYWRATAVDSRRSAPELDELERQQFQWMRPCDRIARRYCRAPLERAAANDASTEQFPFKTAAPLWLA